MNGIGFEANQLLFFINSAGNMIIKLRGKRYVGEEKDGFLRVRLGQYLIDRVTRRLSKKWGYSRKRGKTHALLAWENYICTNNQFPYKCFDDCSFLLLMINELLKITKKFIIPL
jgi:hypothetical protein